MADRNRRTLHFDSLAEVQIEAERCAADPNITTSGHWTAAQIVDHVAILIERSLDGFGGLQAPWVIRVLGRALRKIVLRRPMRPGVKLPAGMRSLQPAEQATMSEAIERLRRCIGRIDAGERMLAKSPVLGDLTHEQWVQLHCRHAELHFSFMHPSKDAD